LNRKKDIATLLITGLFFYRILMAFLAKFVIAKFTILADIGTFIYGLPYDEYGLLPMLYQKFGLMILLKKDVLGVAIISTIHFICHFEILTFCVCSAIGYVGISRFLLAARSDSKAYILLILLCYSPSFNIWSSIGGKECLVVFGMGILCAELIKLYKKEPFKPSILFFVALWLVMVLKKPYIPFVLVTFGYVVFRRCVDVPYKWDVAMLAGLIAAVAVGIYLFRYQLDSYAFYAQNVPRVSARSTRSHLFIEQFDFFRKMPYLIPLAFWGPTWAECATSPLHLFSFMESGVIILTAVVMLWGFPVALIRQFRNYYQWFLLGCNSVFLLLFVQYGQGIINPGAGIRYRTNIYLPVIAFVYIFAYLKERKVEE
jgi:hypothetical protein